jgi:hypothetical protein
LQPKEVDRTEAMREELAELEQEAELLEEEKLRLEGQRVVLRVKDTKPEHEPSTYRDVDPNLALERRLDDARTHRATAERERNRLAGLNERAKAARMRKLYWHAITVVPFLVLATFVGFVTKSVWAGLAMAVMATVVLLVRASGVLGPDRRGK